MVKKKSHEERHGDPVSADEIIENQANTETGTAEDSASAEETKPSEQSSAEEELTKKLTEMQDKYIRLSAEFENYRKRTLREKIELSRTGGEAVIISLLPVVDDFDRAIVSMGDTDDCTAIKQGLELINTKLSAFLKQNGVSEIKAINEPFNPDIHEAVTSTPVDDESLKGKVIEVIRKGYTLHEKVIRFPKVVVGE
jgi:molecular chaperone GrpE